MPALGFTEYLHFLGTLHFQYPGFPRIYSFRYNGLFVFTFGSGLALYGFQKLMDMVLVVVWGLNVWERNSINFAPYVLVRYIGWLSL